MAAFFDWTDNDGDSFMVEPDFIQDRDGVIVTAHTKDGGDAMPATVSVRVPESQIRALIRKLTEHVNRPKPRGMTVREALHLWGLVSREGAELLADDTLEDLVVWMATNNIDRDDQVPQLVIAELKRRNLA